MVNPFTRQHSLDAGSAGDKYQKQAPLTGKQHEEGMERSALWIVATGGGFLFLWWAIAYFCNPEKSLTLMEKTMPLMTLFIGYIVNDAVKRRRSTK